MIRIIYINKSDHLGHVLYVIGYREKVAGENLEDTYKILPNSCT